MKRNILLLLSLSCIALSAIAQNAPRRYAKIVPDGSSGFKIIHLVDTLSTSDRLNKKLDTISAAFYPINDSILTFPDSDLPGRFFNGSLRNSFSQKNNLNISYFIRSDKYSGGAFNRIVNETNRLLSPIDPADMAKRGFIIDDEYKRWIDFRLTQNVLSNGDSCFSKEKAISHGDCDKTIFNADSVIIIQFVAPPYGTCAIGLSKDVILYKKGLGYIVLGYSLVTDWNRQISFQEASDLLDELIKQTWGIIRFNKD